MSPSRRPSSARCPYLPTHMRATATSRSSTTITITTFIASSLTAPPSAIATSAATTARPSHISHVAGVLYAGGILARLSGILAGVGDRAGGELLELSGRS